MVSEPSMYSAWTHWVIDPLPPVKTVLGKHALVVVGYPQRFYPVLWESKDVWQAHVREAEVKVRSGKHMKKASKASQKLFAEPPPHLVPPGLHHVF